MRVLIVEDDAAIAEVMRYALEGAGYDVAHAPDGGRALEMADEQEYGLIVLDIMLPVRDGWDVCRALRQRRNMAPILMLTARDSVDDRVRGLDLGADDYLPKPFAYPEFLARVRTLLRRDWVNKARTLRIADMEIDTARHTVSRAGQVIGLSRREYDLLEALASQEGRTLSRENILDTVWMSETAAPGMVDVYVASLRKKIDAGHDIRLIQTVHGLGYRLRLPGPSGPSDTDATSE